MDDITITRKFAQKLAESLVDNYNSSYEEMSASQRYLAFSELYKDLKVLGFNTLIGKALGDMDVRELAFARVFSPESLKTYMVKHNICPKLWNQ